MNRHIAIVKGFVIASIAGVILNNFQFQKHTNSGTLGYLKNEKANTIESVATVNSSALETKDITSSHVYFTSDLAESLIGFTENELGNTGKVVSINIDEMNSRSKVWLEYELYGLEDYTSVCRSINDQLAVGGQFVNTNTKWSKQSELINPTALKTGENVIRFNLPENASYNYRIKNVSVRIEDAEAGVSTSTTTNKRDLIFNQPNSNIYFNKYGYIRGFVTGEGSENATIRVNGKRIQTEKGIFESVVKNEYNAVVGVWSVNIEADFGDGEIISKQVVFDNPVSCDFPLSESSAKTILSEPLNIKRTEKSFQTADAIALSQDGVELIGDAGSIKQTMQLSATTLRSIDMAPMDGGMENVTGKGKGYRLLPHGSLFEKDMKIRIKYDTALIPFGYTPDDIFTFYYNETQGSWIQLQRDTVDKVNHEIVSSTNHFTDFINGIIKSPEMPEMEAFTPTSIKDIKVANPLEGVVNIEAPTANNKGTANLELPIQIPTGRLGMQPNLSIQYNSSVSNGLLGQGWDISVPAITVETRWGVPRYNATNETESYLMAGEELTPQVQRDGYLPRNASGTKEFFPKVEGAFNKIIRYGNTPKNYYWIVTDKNGIKYYYGNETGSTLTSADGNIAHWALTKVEDLNGNFVQYTYQIKTWTDSNPNSLAKNGKQIYLSRVRYTNSGTVNGKYWVDFTLVTWGPVNVSYRYGFKETTGNLLSTIKVNSDFGIISTYGMTYKTGAFNKALLWSIDHSINGTTSSEITKKTYRFTYNDAVTPAFKSTPESISSINDNLKDGTLFGEPSAISNNKTTDWGGSISAGVGLGFKIWTKMNSVDGKYNFGQSFSKGLSTLMDINGDGYPDKVYTIGDHNIYYRPMLKSGEGLMFFGEPVLVSGINYLSKDKSRTHQAELDFHAGINSNSALNVAVAESWSKTTGSKYFTDVNSDGLVDYVDEGEVLYNKLVNGQVRFEAPVGDTIWMGSCDSNYIINSNPVDTTMFVEDDDETILPPHDVVKMWIAPTNNYTWIKLNGVIRPGGGGTPAEEWIKYSIQHNGIEILVDSVSTHARSKSILLPDNEYISFAKGDRLYFRLFDNKNVNLNNVYWAIKIEDALCLAKNIDDDPYIDANNKYSCLWESDNDFAYSDRNMVGMPFRGVVNIKGSISAPELSDIVHFQIKKNGVIIKDEVFPDNTPISYSLNMNVNVDTSDVIACYLVSNSQVEWSAISNAVEIGYVSVVSTGEDLTGLNFSSLKFKPSIKQSIYSNVIFDSYGQYIPGTTSFTPYLEFSTPGVNGNLILSIKKKHQLWKEQVITITNGIISPSIVNFNNPNEDLLYFDYYTNDIALAKKITGTYSPTSPRAGVHTVYPDSMYKFGNLNRGWGQFVYAPAIANHNLPINENLLYINTNGINGLQSLDTNLAHNFNASNVESAMDIASSILSNNGIPNPLNAVFVPMFLDSTVWHGTSGFGSVEKSRLSTECWFSLNPMENASEISAGEEDDPESIEEMMVNYDSPFPVFVPGKKIRAVLKETKSNTFSVNASVGASLKKIGASLSLTNSKQTSEFMDMNGDGYPDNVACGDIQYSTPFGDLETNHTTISDYENISNSKSLSVGSSAGTTYFNNEKSKANKSFKIKNQGALGLSGASGNSELNKRFSDVNADGLPDYIYNDASGNTFVQLNMGYDFDVAINLGKNLSQQSGSNLYSLSNSVAHIKELDKWEHSLSLGVGFTASDDITKDYLLDINGDGMQDKINQVDDKLYVYYNTGNGFTTTAVAITLPEYRKTVSNNQSLNIAFTFGFSTGLKFICTPELSGSKSSSTTKTQFMDINNDGYVDLVTSNNGETDLKVYYSTLKDVNLLTNVKNPSGSEIALGYGLSECSQQSPQRYVVLDSVMVKDGYYDDGFSTPFNTFTYLNPYYDRFERISYGFETVNTLMYECYKKYPYRELIEKYYNDTYLFKGIEKYDLISSVNDECGIVNKDTLKKIVVHKYIETYYNYKLKRISDGSEVNGADPNCLGSYYPAISSEDRYFYEGQENYQIHTRKEYTHTSFGNVSEYKDLGDVAITNDDVKAVINYKSIPALNILSLADTIKVYSISTGNLLRKRCAEYNSKGQLTAIKIYNTGNKISTTAYFYDSYGNINHVTYPLDVNNQFKELFITYDNTVYTYPVTIQDEKAYKSQATYNYKFGKPLTITDVSGVKIQYAYYFDGRLKQVLGPNETSYTIKFEYPSTYPLPAGQANWAITRHYDPANTSYDIITSQFVDGLGRALQTKKTTMIYTPSSATNGVDEIKMLVSGKVYYDEYGRIYSYYPTVENYDVNKLKVITNILVNPEKDPNTFIKNDPLEREKEKKLPGNKFYYYYYSFGTDKFGVTRFQTTTTDPNGKYSYVYKDHRDLQTSVTDALGGITAFNYNVLGELCESYDPEDNITTHTYDMLGQRTQTVHPDAGTTNYEYDNAGNLIFMQTQNLINETQKVNYIYDYGRLKEVRYPQNPEMNVYYTYGLPNVLGANRIVKQQDASGVQSFAYGKLGEMTENTHTFVMPGGSNYTFKMLWQYDSWNRIKLITYPDGEKVTYTYKKYGQLSTVTSLKDTSSTTLITSVFFDKFGNRLKINYGNGTYCNYTYDPVSLRLSTLKSYDKNSKPMQTLAYTYDNVGNITAINNTAVTMPNGMGGPYNYNYTYDDLYRLDSASGSWKTTAGNYNLKMNYSPSGNILQKTLTALTSINGVNINIDKDYSYSYNSAKPHAVTNVFSFAYGYDANGNMTSDCPTRTCRTQAWDEENRLTTVNDKNKSYLSNYLYDAGGERIIKLSGAIQKIMQQNGDIIEFANLGENISINFGAHMVLNNNRYTKHYYIEGQRICSKLGKGFSAPPVGITQSVTPISGNYNDIKTNVLKMLRKGDIRVGFDSTNTTYPASITIVPNSTAAETDRYFYHSDHLGSSSFISSNLGTTTQHLQYLPFGESFVEQKSTTAYLSPYRFSGKEKDEETGYSYFGARYYNPELSVWLSVDPLAEKYPSTSAYMYCAGNPVMLVDPDGRRPDNYTSNNDGTVTKTKTTEKTDNFYVTKSDGTIELVAGNVPKIVVAGKTAGTTITMVEFPKSTKYTNLSSESKYIIPEMAAALFGAAEKYNNETNDKFHFTQLNAANGSHSYSTAAGKKTLGTGFCFDMRFASIDNKSTTTGSSNYNKANSEIIAASLFYFGIETLGASVKNLSIDPSTKKQTISWTPALIKSRPWANHNDHIHGQLYDYNKLKIDNN